MNIQEAIIKALKEKKFITRKSWPKGLKVAPARHIPCDLLAPNTPPGKGWQPDAEDLIADDWQVVE